MVPHKHMQDTRIDLTAPFYVAALFVYNLYSHISITVVTITIFDAL